ADGADTRQKGGTGLGLSISQSLVEEHGGTIRFETAPGAGTTFIVDLPLAPPQEAAAS
ncbi:two-component sensor histidine kinase, partial [Acinetobacter baumannii]|uniref:ATP-binding protein n=1 Tax=Acinetobacter baumannii TaxID=470 RepID=UPI001F55932E